MLPEDLELKTLGLFEFLGLPCPTSPIAGIDVFLPLIERIRSDRNVFLIKWDWERSAAHFTCVLSFQASPEAIRRDHSTAERAIAQVLLQYAEKVWDFTP